MDLREADEISVEDLEAAACVFDGLVDGTYYEKQEQAEAEIKTLRWEVKHLRQKLASSGS